MEFDTNTPPTDDARLLAEVKKLTLQPVHSDVTPEDLPDSVVVANHLRAGAIANVSTDIEQDAPLIAASQEATAEHPRQQAKLYVLTATGFVILVAVAVFVAFGS